MESISHTHPRRQSLLDRYFSFLESLRASDAFLMRIAVLACAGFFILSLVQTGIRHSIDIASPGGTFSEGIIGTPRFISPVLAATRADKDLSALIYDGLMTLGAEGALVPNVAESITVSEDGLTYNVVLKRNVVFHDGTPLTARDVAFTIERIQDPLLTSPLRANFDGIVVEEINEYELNFILPEAYTPFIENLTFGIMPEHVWKDVSSDAFPFSKHNSEPIGSGPYRIEEILRNASGIPQTYVLAVHPAYHLGMPKIEHVTFSFFSNEEQVIAAFRKGTIDAVSGVDPAHLTEYDIHNETHHLERIPLPRTFAVFFNQNKSTVLRDPSVRNALNTSINRQQIIDTILGGYGNPLHTPIPVGFGVGAPVSDTEEESGDTRAILEDGGWKLNSDTNLWEKEIDGTRTSLAFSITTANSDAFATIAEMLATTWRELGIEVTVKQFEQSDLTQAVIRPRDYEALLFGTQLGRPLDFYSFWHSSQRNDPGLNVALYANITTDSILTEMRRNSDQNMRAGALSRFAEEIAKETPAVFLFAPELLYIFPNHVSGASFGGVGEPHERLSGIREWYTETESIWPYFSDQ